MALIHGLSRFAYGFVFAEKIDNIRTSAWSMMLSLNTMKLQGLFLQNFCGVINPAETNSVVSLITLERFQRGQ
jgi:hypothetical protein